MCKRPVKSPIKANLCSFATMEYLLPRLRCSTNRWNKPRRERGRGGEEETGCEAERAEDEKKEVE